MDFSRYIINRHATIREAFKKEDENGEKFVLVCDDNEEIIGIVTNGDFRRAIWDSVSLEDEIESITNKNFLYFNDKHTGEEVKQAFIVNKNIRQIPVLKNGKLVKILRRNDYKPSELRSVRKRLNIPAVIMAGGKGTRLDPFTKVLPKPLLPVGEKAVIEVIMDEFAKFGVSSFYISVNEKAKMIKAYFEESVQPYSISFLEEKKPLGTAGALKMLKGKIDKPFFVSNCDIIIDADYKEFYDFHLNGKFDLSLVSSMQYHTIPYGICHINRNGVLDSIQEKPEYDLLVNTGMYLLNPEVLDLIPTGKFFHMTDLINKLQKKNKKIGVFPISSNSWLDVGQWEEYKKTLEKVRNVL